MSSFATRHTRTQLTTENVVFDKVLLLLVLFGSEMLGNERTMMGGVYMVWLPFFAIVGARSLVRSFARSHFFLLDSRRFSCFSSCIFLLLLRRFDPLLLIFLPLCFFFISCFLVFSFSCFFRLLIFTLLWSHAETQKRNERENDSARYVCIFIRYMYNVLGSAIITIIQLCGLCRLFVHSTLPLLYCCCYHCMGKHSPSTLKVMPLFFCCCFLFFRSLAAETVLKPLLILRLHAFSLSPLCERARLLNFSFFFGVCAFLRKRASSAQFMDRRHSLFSVSYVCVCVCIIYTVHTFVVDVGGVSAAM